jgi:dipeptidyl aminopeptidase/acylaminoacyl peptidase
MSRILLAVLCVLGAPCFWAGPEAMAQGGAAQAPLAASPSTGAKLPFQVRAMMRLARVADPQISPDGLTVLFQATKVNLDENKSETQIYSVPISGGAPRPLTSEGNNTRPRWTPDGSAIYFLSTRGEGQQIWRMRADGSAQTAVTRLSTGADGHLISPDGRKLVFTSEVFPECGADDACNQQKLAEQKANPVNARVYSQLLYRHWNQWQGKQRKHLFSANIDGSGVVDLTPGDRDVPPFSLGGGDDYDISPESTEVCYVHNPDPVLATSTNGELFVVPIGGGEAVRVTNNPGNDTTPRYSPDGKSLAWRMQSQGGFESDRWRLVVMERASGKWVPLTDSVDRSVDDFVWMPDSQRLAFLMEDRGRHTAHLVRASGGGSQQIINNPASVSSLAFTRDQRKLVYAEASGSKPAEIYVASSDGGVAMALARMNDDVLATHQLTPLEDFWVDGAEGARVQSFVVKPPDFDPSKKYPVLFLIHGGPQGAWGESWSYRWNAQIFAGAGYLVVMPNPRGSTGYGQRFTDEVSADWGGKAYLDIMATVDHVAKLPYVDAERMGAAGASYGGYMVNWILGNTTRFKALVSHAGVYDLESMFGETEELWFPLWEFRGAPWQTPDIYRQWSPSKRVEFFRTPTLVTHGERDYRVPFGQGLQLYTALQMRKVPSKLILFPEEGHWILKPKNSEFWYQNVLAWLDEWVKAGKKAGETPVESRSPFTTRPAPPQ